MRVAAIQMCSGASVEANLLVASQWLSEAAREGARVAVLPENFAFLGRSDRDRLELVEPQDSGTIQDFLAEQARALGLWIVGGTVPLVTERADHLRAACLVYDDRGRRVARYDKMHLFDVAIPEGVEEYRESEVTEPGDRAVVVDSPAGRLGLAVCYDLRFPELFRRLLAMGAELVALPAAFTVPTGRAHWETLLRARAIENLYAVIAAAQGGRHASGRETYGDSMIVDAWGTILARQAHGAGLVIADLDMERQARIRASFPALQHRRPDLVDIDAEESTT